MKKLFFFLLILSIAVSCKPKEQKMMEKMLFQEVGVTTVSTIQEYKTITLADEVGSMIDSVLWSMKWDESFYDSFISYACDPELPEDQRLNYQILADKCLNNVYHSKKILNYLEAIEELYSNVYDDVSFTIYRLPYVTVDSTGYKITRNCFGKFNKSKQMTAFRLTGTSEWKILGHCCSIPGYDK